MTLGIYIKSKRQTVSTFARVLNCFTLQVLMTIVVIVKIYLSSWQSSKSIVVAKGRIQNFLNKQIFFPLFQWHKGVGLWVYCTSFIFLFNIKLCEQNKIVLETTTFIAFLTFVIFLKLWRSIQKQHVNFVPLRNIARYNGNKMTSDCLYYVYVNVYSIL